MTKAEAEAILDLEGTYTWSQARSAYHKQAISYHPDNASKNGYTEEYANRRMRQVNEAYQVVDRWFKATGANTATVSQTSATASRAASATAANTGAGYTRTAASAHAKSSQATAGSGAQSSGKTNGAASSSAARQSPLDDKVREERRRWAAEWEKAQGLRDEDGNLRKEDFTDSTVDKGSHAPVASSRFKAAMRTLIEGVAGFLPLQDCLLCRRRDIPAANDGGRRVCRSARLDSQ